MRLLASERGGGCGWFAAHSAMFAMPALPFPSLLTFPCRLASKILKITQAHTKEAAAKSWRRNNLEAMEMPVDDEDESDSGEVGREEEFAQRMKRKAKEEQVHSPRSALLPSTNVSRRSWRNSVRL